MEKFENATIVKKANIYFDGKVSSRTVLFADGSRKTLGIMLPGDYEFDTAAKEVMEILEVSLKCCFRIKTIGKVLRPEISSMLQLIRGSGSGSGRWSTTVAPMKKTEPFKAGFC